MCFFFYPTLFFLLLFFFSSSFSLRSKQTSMSALIRRGTIAPPPLHALIPSDLTRVLAKSGTLEMVSPAQVRQFFLHPPFFFFLLFFPHLWFLN